MKKTSKKAILYRLDALEQQVSRIESRPLPRKVSRDFASFGERLDAVSKVVAGIDCLTDALKRKANELDDRVEKIERHGVPRRLYKDFVNSEERLAAVEKKLAALRGRLDAERDEQAAAFAEFRAQLAGLEGWMCAAQKICSAIRIIPFPKPKAEALCGRHAVKAAEADK